MNNYLINTNIIIYHLNGEVMKLLASIALLIICLTSAQPTQAAPSYTEQEKVVHHLYHDFAWQALMVPSPYERLPYQPKAVLLQYFEPTLTDLFVADAECARREGLCHLDFDPIFDTQDPSVVSIDIKQSSKPDEVIVRFNEGLESGRQHAITCKLKQGNSGWRISDIVYPHGLTLRQILSLK